MYDDQTPPALRRVLLFVVAALVALVLPLVLVSRLMGPQSAGGGAKRPPAAATVTTVHGATIAAEKVSSSSPPSPTGDNLSAQAESCRLGSLRQQTAMGAAAASLEQFQNHIEAMNLLVAGKISLQAATKFWDQTRVAAAQKAADFRTADKAVREGGASCPELGPTAACSAPIDRVEAITACAKAEQVRLGVLGRARTAVTTWEHHIHDMDAMMSGTITPSQATSRWQKNWKTGQKEVDAYNVASQLTLTIRCPLS